MSLIGLDIGTTTLCGLLYYRNDLYPSKVAVRPNTFIPGDTGEYLQDPEQIFRHIKSILDELINEALDKIEGISLSTQMHGILYVDRDGQSVSPYYTWQNQRGLTKTGDKSLEKYVSDKLGYSVYTGYGIVTHYSLDQDNLIPVNASSFCNIGDFVCMKLVEGRTPVTDVTIGNSMGICAVKTGRLVENVSSLSADCENFVPKLISTTTLLGNYKSIPVIQPIGDNQASFLGSVKDKGRSLLINYGTAGQISFHTESYNEFSGFETRPLGNEGFIHAAFSLGGGNSYKLMARFFEETLKYFIPDSDIDCLGGMNNMELDFSKDDIDCMPLFLGKRGLESKTGYFRNITEENFTPPNMVKALVQGMVNEMYQYYKALPERMKNRIDILIGAGNGIRKNPHLVKAVELKYGKSLRFLAVREESCLGAVINAGKGVGLFTDYDTAAAEIVKYLE